MKQKHLGILIGCLSAVGGAGIASAGFAIANAVQNKQNYSQSLQDCKNDAYGRIGTAATEALGRIPESYGKVTSYVSLFTNALESDWITPQKAFSIGILAGGGDYLGIEFGSGSIDSIARVLANKDEEKYNIMTKDTKDLLEIIKTETSDAAFAVGVSGTSFFDSYYRQPDILDDLRSLINDCLKPFFQYINSNNSLAVGKILSNTMEAMARQPESISNLKEIAYTVVNKLVKSNLTFLQAKAYAKTCAGGFDALGRQPEAKSAICSLLYTMLYEIIDMPSDLSIAYYYFGYSVSEAIARQPEAFDEINGALTKLMIPSIRKANASQAETIGNIGASMFDAIARIPNWSNLIIMEAKALIEIVLGTK